MSEKVDIYNIHSDCCSSFSNNPQSLKRCVPDWLQHLHQLKSWYTSCTASSSGKELTYQLIRMGTSQKCSASSFPGEPQGAGPFSSIFLQNFSDDQGQVLLKLALSRETCVNLLQDRYHSLWQWFSNLSKLQNHLGWLLKTQSSGLHLWSFLFGKAWNLKNLNFHQVLQGRWCCCLGDLSLRCICLQISTENFSDGFWML